MNKSYSYAAIGTDTYGSEELADIFGMSLRQLQVLDDEEVVMPPHRGHARNWTRRDAYLVAIAGSLRKWSKSTRGAGPGYGRKFRNSMQAIARTLSRSQPRFLIVTADGVEHADSEGQLLIRLEKLGTAGIPSIMINLDAIGRKLERGQGTAR